MARLQSELDIAQESKSQWLQWRKEGLGGSDAPIIMGVSPFMTPRELAQEKLGLKSFDQTNYATMRGQIFEPKARAMFETLYDMKMSAELFVHPEHSFLRCSLDGWNEEKREILEIKVPGKEVFELAKSGEVHEQYVWQLEHQLLVTGAKKVHFFCVQLDSKNFDASITDHAHVVYESDPKKREELFAKAKEFWALIEKKELPPLTERDVLERTDEEAVLRFKKLKEVLKLMEKMNEDYEKVEEQAEKFKQEIIAHMRHSKETAAGVSITKIVKKGSVDWKKVEASGVKLEDFEREPVTYYQVRLLKEER